MTQFKQYWKLIIPYWKSRDSLLSWILFFGTIGASLTIVYSTIHLNQLHGKFYNYIELKDKDKIAENFVMVSKIIGIFLLVFSLQSLLQSLVNFRWRKWMTSHFLSKWMKKKAYYFQNRLVDNPDQRISEDINAFSSGITTIIFLVFHNVLSLFSFFLVLWNFSTPYTFSINEKIFEIPHYLALFSIIYAILVNAFTLWAGKPLVSLAFKQEKHEANFRFSLFRIKEYGEEVAFNKGEAFEEEIFVSKFSQIKNNYYKIIKRNFCIQLIERAHYSLLSIFPILLSLPLLLSGEITIGSMMQISGAFSYVLSSFCLLVTAYPMFASIHATKNRLFEFLNFVEHSVLESARKLDYTTLEGNGITFSKISILNPMDQQLISNVSFTIMPGEKVLIMGRSGLGKTSLLRTLAKLWNYAEGSIALPKDKIFFIPQKPYFPLAKLSDVLGYPLLSKAETHEELKQILKDVYLPHLIPLLEEEKDWMRRLSLGEQQRLNFARVLYHKPKVVVMDEPSSALDSRNEREMFELLQKKLHPETTIMTVSHSEELKFYHDKCISLDHIANKQETNDHALDLPDSIKSPLNDLLVN